MTDRDKELMLTATEYYERAEYYERGLRDGAKRERRALKKKLDLDWKDERIVTPAVVFERIYNWLDARNKRARRGNGK